MFTTLHDRPELAWSEPERYAALSAESLAEFARSRLAPEQSVEMTVVPRERPA